MSKLPFSKSQSTDEDYESDDSEIDKLRTRLVDPVEDRGLIEELLIQRFLIEFKWMSLYIVDFNVIFSGNLKGCLSFFCLSAF